MAQDLSVDPADAVAVDDSHELWPAGESAKGEFHCSGCGYGVTVYRTLPSCPMCGCEEWEQSAWSPFARAPGSSGLF